MALLTGCAQRVLAPQINEATIRLLTRHGCEVVVAEGAGCCGALTHHLGRDAHDFCAREFDAWTRVARAGLDAVVDQRLGLRHHGQGLRLHVARRSGPCGEQAAAVSAMARDVTELMAELGLRAPAVATGQRVAYHCACSLQHGQQIRREPKALLQAAGFEVVDIPEGHLCCGSAGTYNLLQPAIATHLRDRKLENIARIGPQIIAAGNIGCMTQIATGTTVPVVHTVELLDWATGGPMPAGLSALATA